VWTESERRRELGEVGRGLLAQTGQHLLRLQRGPQRTQGRGLTGEEIRQPLAEGFKRCPDRDEPPLDPTDGRGQVRRFLAGIGRPEPVCRPGSTDRLPDLYYLLHLGQRPRKARGQEVRKQAHRPTSGRTVEASHQHPRRMLALVRPVAAKPAAALRVPWTALDPCGPPRLLPNVLIAGQPGGEPNLHQHPGPARSDRAGRSTPEPQAPCPEPSSASIGDGHLWKKTPTSRGGTMRRSGYLTC